MLSAKKIGFCLLFLTVTVSGFVTDPFAVTIESAESKNSELQPVYNQIQYFPGWNKDVWMMNQSHHGAKPATQKWDRLAIVVDKTTSPSTAKFYQLSSGPLIWEEELLSKRVEFSVSCMICHNNGPRAIRPNWNSEQAPLSLKDRLRIGYWNLRIKTYGRIQYDPVHDEEDTKNKIPFSHKTTAAKQELKVKTCTHCHKESGWFARGALQRQQVATIESLVSRGEMPPPGFTLTKKETQELQDFIKGF